MKLSNSETVVLVSSMIGSSVCLGIWWNNTATGLFLFFTWITVSGLLSRFFLK